MNKWLMQLILLVIQQVSPHIREAVCKMLVDLKKQADETDNPWDNVLVGLGQTILDCPEK